jgi:hypothetical protein
MENYANHGFILLIPIFLMSLGFIIAFFWTRQRQYLSVLWLAFAQLSAGSVMFVQSLIIPSHLHQWSMLLGGLYVFTFIALAQSISLAVQYSNFMEVLSTHLILHGNWSALSCADGRQPKCSCSFGRTWHGVGFCHKLPAIMRIKPLHPIDKWLRIVFIAVSILMIMQSIFKIKIFI